MREKSELSQQKFADSIGLSRNEINRIENNRTKATVENIDTICVFMKMSKKELFDEFA